MQVLTLIKAISVALAAGSLSFLLAEWRFYRHTFGEKKCLSTVPPDSVILSTHLWIFGPSDDERSMFRGELPQTGQSSPEEVLSLFYYWSAIAGLALISIILI